MPLRAAFIAFAIALIFIATNPLRASAAADTDALFSDAKTLAFSGKWDAAQTKCAEILLLCPSCHDARVLSARIHSWKKEYPAAREALQKVLEQKPDYHDATDALIDVELWSGAADKALSLCNSALKVRPGSAPLLYKRALALEKLGQLDAAIAAAHEALSADASNTGASKLIMRLETQGRKYSAALTYTTDSYDSVFSPQNSLTVEMTRKFPYGPITIRAASSHRFGKNGVQLEAEAYPKLAKKTYAWLNAGFSQNSIYPTSRLGIEVYTALPRGYEFSLGARRMNFASDNPEIFTASLAKFTSRWSYTGREYFSRKSNGDSHSGTLNIKRYYHGGGSHLGLTLGAGSSPSESIYALDSARLGSRSASIEWKQPSGRSSSVTMSLGYGDEDFSAGGDIQRLSFSLSLRTDY